MEIASQITNGSVPSKINTDINDTGDIFIKAMHRVSKQSIFLNDKIIRLDEFLDALTIERDLKGEKYILGSKNKKRYKSH